MHVLFSTQPKILAGLVPHHLISDEAVLITPKQIAAKDKCLMWPKTGSAPCSSLLPASAYAACVLSLLLQLTLGGARVQHIAGRAVAAALDGQVPSSQSVIIILLAQAQVN